MSTEILKMFYKMLKGTIMFVLKLFSVKYKSSILFNTKLMKSFEKIFFNKSFILILIKEVLLKR